MNTIGIIGAGVMGRKLIECFLEKGIHPAVYDRSKARMDKLGGMDIKPVDSIAEVTAGADIIFLSLPGPAEVEEVMTGSEGILAHPPFGGVVIDTTTSRPDTSERMYSLAKEAGFSFADAPILGRPSGAGNWLFPVGGDRGTFERIEDLLLIPGKKAVFIPGGPGAGHKLKLVNQLIFTVTNTITCEVMAIVEKSGLDPTVVYETIKDSGAATVSGLFRETAGKIVDNDFDPLFSIDLLRKDAGLGIEAAKSWGASPVIAALSQTMNDLAYGQGYGNRDTGALVNVYRSLYSERSSE